MKKIVGEVVNENDPPQGTERVTEPTTTLAPTLTYADERERQRALEVIEDLIQRTSSDASRALYVQQREKILRASIQEKPFQAVPTLGPFPSHGR